MAASGSAGGFPMAAVVAVAAVAAVIAVLLAVWWRKRTRYAMRCVCVCVCV